MTTRTALAIGVVALGLLWLESQAQASPTAQQPSSGTSCGPGSFWVACTQGDVFCQAHASFRAAGGYCASKGVATFSGVWDPPDNFLSNGSPDQTLGPLVPA